MPWETYRDQIGCQNRQAETNLHEGIFEYCWSFSSQLLNIVLTGFRKISSEIVFLGREYRLE